MVIFGIFGLIFTTLGFTMYAMSESIQSVSAQYDTCNVDSGSQCQITIDIEADIPAPVYVYYQLDNFY